MLRNNLFPWLGAVYAKTGHRSRSAKPAGICRRAVLPSWIAAAMLLAGAGMSLQAESYVNRVGTQGQVQDVTIDTATTWSAANSPYIMEARLTINQGVTLTIEPGVVVQVNANLGIYDNGVIAARNATFTINGAGNWAGIYLSPNSGDSIFEGCTFRQSGANLGYIDWADRHTAIYVNRCAPAITGCTFADLAGHGVELISSAAVIKNNVFTNMGNGYYAIAYNSLDTFPFLAGNTASGTGVLGIAVPGGNVGTTNTWNKPGANFPYFLNGDITVGGGVQLTIDPGVLIKTAGTKIGVDGTLLAVGTAAEPIGITSTNDVPAPGDWRGIYFGPGAGNSVLRYCALSFGGNNLGYFNWADRYTVVYVNQSSPTFDHLTLASSKNHGLWFFASGSAISSSLIKDCGGNGLIADTGSRVSISDSSFVNNGTAGDGSYTVAIEGTSIVTPSNVTFSNNRLQGVQIWGGTLAADGVWKNWADNAPYVITGDITVNNQVTLTVEQKTTVKLQNSRLFVNGVLKANGNPNLITFTSWRDDTVAGNTEGTDTAPAAGDWKGIYLSPGSSASLFDNCAFRYGGKKIEYLNWADRWAFFYVNQSAPTIRNCSFADSIGHGVELYSSTATVQDNSFNNMADGAYAVVFDLTDRFPVMSGNQASGTGIPGIAVPGGNISGAQTWNKPGNSFPYYLNGQLTVPAGAQLTLEHGVNILSSGQKIWIDGTLKTLGTATDRVFFSSRNAKPAPGDWLGVYFGGAAGNSRLSYCTISYGGSNLGYINGGDRWTSVYVNQSNPAFDHVTIANSLWQGLWFYASASQVDSLIVEQCGGHALYAQQGSRPNLVNPTFIGNGYSSDDKSYYFTVAMDSSCVPNPVGATFVTNRWQGIALWGEVVLGANGLWKNWATNAPYVVTGDTTINGGVTLAIEPNTTVKFKGTRLFVNGTLNAVGTAGPIHFTSWLDDRFGGDTDGTNSVGAASDWKGIYLSPASGASVLDNCTVSFPGARLEYINYADRYTAIYVNSCSPTIRNCAITDSGSHGIEVYSCAGILQNNAFVNVAPGAYAVVLDTLDYFPQMGGNSGQGTGILGIAVPGGSLGANMIWNKPGANFPYYLNGEVSVADGNILTIDPGVTVRSGGPKLAVNGTLRAVGTVEEPITFTSRNSQPARRDWAGIYFGPNAGNSLVRFCTLSYAGAKLGYFNWADRYTAIYLNNCSPSLHNIIVAHCGGYGLEFENSSALLESSLIYSNAWSNVRLSGGGAAQIINNTIVQSDGVGIYCANGSPVVANNILAFNATDGFRRDAGTPALWNNCVFGNVESNYFTWPAGTNDFSADPLFVDRTSFNFRLAAQSPCLSGGDSTAILPTWMDLDGRLRTAGAGLDLGAYELGAAMALRDVDGLIRNQGDAAYIGANIFDVPPQTKYQTKKAGIAAVYQFQTKYTGNLPEDLLFTAPAGNPSWTVRYFDSLTGTKDITAQITQLGWLVTNVAPNAIIEFRVEITADEAVPGLAAFEAPVSVVAQGYPTKRDTVKAVMVNAARSLVDLQIRRAEDIQYIGTDIYNNSGAGQTKNREVDQGETATYQIRVVNQGNIPDTFVLHGTAGGQGWSIRYFDTLTGTNDVTAAITGAGQTITNLPMLASAEIRVEVSGDATVAGNAAIALSVSATSQADNTKTDTVKAVTTMMEASSTAQGGTYTLNADFEKGVLVGVEYTTVPDQLQLAAESVTLPFIWVPNSNEGTVSKVDTRTGRELGRYHTGPAANGDCSRTTVDQDGNCWIVNRGTGTVIKIGLFENGQYIDRNGNGLVDTSQDRNGDGIISGEEMLPWGQDECVLYEVVLIAGLEGTFIPGTYTNKYSGDPIPRSIAVDGKGNVWAGAYNTKKYYYLEGATAQILRTVDVSSVNHTPYGSVVDSQGILWSAGIDKNHVLRLDPKDNSFRVINIGHTVYGIALDQHNHLFVSGWQASKLSRLNILTETVDWTVNGFYQSRGVAVTEDGDVWVAESVAEGAVTRWSNDGKVKATIPVGNTPTGVSVDSDGKVWVVNDGDEYIKRINPANNAVDLSKRINGGVHYGYSDMTGIISRNATTRFGRWTVVHNAKLFNTPWGTVTWHSQEPQDTSLKVRVRSSNDKQNWTLWETVRNGSALASTSPGKYLEVEVTMQTLSLDASPVLYDLTVTPAGQVNLGEITYQNNFQSEPGTEWSVPATDVTPVGNRKFLGQFGNTNVTLTLSSLPPHSAVTVAFDLYIIRSWDGCATNDGPDIWELNVAGGRKLCHATFNNGPTNSVIDGQTYPDEVAAAIHPALSEAAETNTLGYVYQGRPMDAVYRISRTVTHSADTLVLDFLATGLHPDLAEESWGLANVQVFVTPTAPPFRLTPMGMTLTGHFQLRLTGEAQRSYVIEASSDLKAWSPVSTNVMAGDSIDSVDPDASQYQYRFYRALEHE